MTLKEAIKSGKRFKRPCYEVWLKLNKERNSIEWSNNSAPYHPGIELSYDDWEVEEKKVEITREMFLSAFISDFAGYDQHHIKTFANNIADRLGL